MIRGSGTDADQFTMSAARAVGYEGFVPLLNLSDDAVPKDPGVYRLLRAPATPPRYTAQSSGGHFKQRDPAVPIERLEANWVDGCETLYIGKATSLRKRLVQYRRFGAGEPVGHWGGRFVWQLEDAEKILVCWSTTPTAAAAAAEESRLLAEFLGAFRSLPFANLTKSRVSTIMS